jgi:hypothetical protein
LPMQEGEMILCILLGLIPLTLMVRRVCRLWLRGESNSSHTRRLKLGTELRAVKSLTFAWISAMSGLAVGKVLVPPVLLPWKGILSDHSPQIVAYLGLLGAILGGVGAYYLFWQSTRPKSGPLLTPDVERDVREKFTPSNGQQADASIQPETRGLKPGEP